MSWQSSRPWVSRATCLAFFLSTGEALCGETTLSLESVGVEDGDTLLVPLSGGAERIQLAGIDAPEDMDNPKLQRDLERTGLTRDHLLAIGGAATAHLRHLVSASGPYRLVLDPDRRDRYGRLTAKLLDAAGHSVGTLMVEHGYAISLRAPTTEVDQESAALGAAEARAHASGQGLWGTEGQAMGLWSGQTKP